MVFSRITLRPGSFAWFRGDFVIVDGTLIPTGRIKADEPYYSQKHRKHRKHGMNVQVIARADGTPLLFSRAQPGHTHDMT